MAPLLYVYTVSPLAFLETVGDSLRPLVLTFPLLSTVVVVPSICVVVDVPLESVLVTLPLL